MALREASFKGVPFKVDETEGQFGRRNVLHQYPYRDLPFAEDLGREVRRFSVHAFVLTQPEYDALVEALESEGPGTLIHPWYGSVFVQHDGQQSVTYPRAEGGRFDFRLSFVEAGENNEPDVQEDAGGLLSGLVDDALSQVGIKFEAEWLRDIDGWLDVAAQRADELMKGFEYYLTPLERGLAGVDRLTSGGRGLLAKPIELYYRVAGLIRKIAAPFQRDTGSSWQADKSQSAGNLAEMPAFQVTSRPDRDRAMLDTLRGREPQISARPQWTLPYSRRNQTDLPPMPSSLADAVRRTLVLEQARGIGSHDYASQSELLSDRDLALFALHNEMQQASGRLFRALDAVQAQVVRTAQARLPTIRELAVVETLDNLPALLVAYRVNGSIEAYEDVVARNHVRHPLFVPAGRVEVLRDGE